MPVILIHHDKVGLPEMLLLEHRPDGRIKGDGIGSHHAYPFRDQVTCCLSSHPAVVGQVAFLSVVRRCTRLNEYDIPLLKRIANLLECLVDVGNANTRTIRLVPEVEYYAIGVAIFERNTFWSWSFRTPNMFYGITMCSNVIALDDEIGCSEPFCPLGSGTDALGELSPALIHK